jgi:hypothetical protein
MIGSWDKREWWLEAMGSLVVNTFFEVRLEQLIRLAETVEEIFSAAELEYRLVGGVATYFYVEEASPDAGRLTKDVDVVVRREDLEKISQAAESFGFGYRQVAGVDMLVRVSEPSVRRAIHLIFACEKVRPTDPEPVPALREGRRIRGIRLIPLEDLIRMKLTSFRAKDAAHIIDLDEAGLITPEIEAGLSPILRERLAEARARG